MALFDNALKIGAGLAIGIGALIVAPKVIPGLESAVRPILKAAIKSGLVLAEKTMEFFAEAKESFEDMTAEAFAELANERQGITHPVPETETGANT